MNRYFDWNATTPPLAEVLATVHEVAAKAWGNPASTHATGRFARSIVEDARAAVGSLMRADPRDIVFTSGGTEANNMALRAAFGDSASASATLAPSAATGAAPSAGRVSDDRAGDGPWLVTSRLEHPSVTRVAEQLERERRARVRWLAVTSSGVVDLDDLDRALCEIPRGKVALVTVQAVNHETGVLQPVQEVALRAHAVGARVHVDAVQAWGKIDASLFADVADTASLAAHKIRGPKGIGALVSRQAGRLTPVLLGGAQERGLRPGTVDAALCAGLGVAARHALTGHLRYANIAARRDTLESGLQGLIQGDARGVIVGDPQQRAPHVSQIVWPAWQGAELVAALDLEGVSASSGSACSAGTVEPSPVIEAMLGARHAASGLRMSLGEDTTEDDVAYAIEAFRRVVAR